MIFRFSQVLFIIPSTNLAHHLFLSFLFQYYVGTNYNLSVISEPQEVEPHYKNSPKSKTWSWSVFGLRERIIDTRYLLSVFRFLRSLAFRYFLLFLGIMASTVDQTTIRSSKSTSMIDDHCWHGLHCSWPAALHTHKKTSSSATRSMIHPKQHQAALTSA